MVTTKLNLSMTEPQVRQIYAKQGDTGRVLDITLDQTPEDGTLRILRPDGVEVTSEAVTGGEVESGGTFESLTEADVTELSVGIEPIQDLNGYDKPWVGGAGVNIIGDFALANNPTSGGEITATRQSDGSTYVLNGTATATRDVYILPIGSYPLEEGEYSAYAPTGTGINGTSRYFYIVVYNGTSSRYIRAGGTSSSSSFTIASGEEVMAMFIRVGAGVNTTGKIVTPMIVKGTTAPTSYSPYSNICPITGHDEVRVTRTGKNLCSQTGVNNAVIGQAKQGMTYTFSVRNQGSCGYNIKKNNNSGATLASTEGEHPTDAVISVTFTADEDCNLFLNGYGVNGYTFLQSAYDYQLELGSTATAYEPYQGSTYTTSLGQTVYGGTLDMVTGVLTVDKAISVYQGGSDEGWTTRTTSSGYTLFEYFLSNVSVGIPASQVGLCNEFAWDRELAENIRYRIVNSTLTVRYDGLSLADWKAFLASNPMQVVYPIATPLTYTLTAQQIKTLVGTNNVWASSGDIVNITFTYGGLLSELPSDATSVVGKCYCDVEQNGVSSMPFTLNVKKNERQ